MSKLSGVDKFAARLLMISFFLPQVAQAAAAVLTCLYFVFRTFSSKQPVPLGNYVWALLIGSFYLLYLFAIPLTPNEYKHFLSLLCQRKASLLFMPLVFAIITPSFGELIMGEIMYFVYGCVASCLAGNADFIYHYLTGSGGTDALSHVHYRIIFETFTGTHPTYMGMFLVFSICITLLYTIANSPGEKVLKYGLLYLQLIFLLALLAKSPVIALVIIAIHYAYTQRKTLYRYKMLIAGSLVFVIAACFFIPFVGQRINELVQFSGSAKHGNVADNSVYVRQLIWSVDTDMLRQYWLTGVGPGRLLHMLHERYFFYSIAHNYFVGNLDPHNEYFYEWLCFGVTGILLFVAVLVTHFVKALRATDQLYIYLLILLYITFFTETVLSRQQGVLFYAIFTSFFFFRARSLVSK